MEQKSGMPQYPPQPPPAYSNTSSNVVIAQPSYIQPLVFREVPTHCRCPKCGAEVLTSTQYETGALTWLICVMLALIGLWLGCCLIPFCVDGCKDVVHSCPNCKNVVGIYRRLS